ESIGMLAGGIAHDLNNVLAPIMMSVDLLKGRLPDEDSQKILEALEVSARRGADMVSQVVYFARGVEGDHTLLQLNELIRDLQKIGGETFPKSIRTRTAIAPDLWTVYG